MRIVMVANTYLPFVGGATLSVSRFAAEYRRQGHEAIVVAPEYADAPKDEEHVVRVPAITNFASSRFSIPLPAFRVLLQAIDEFQPDIIHAHHPYLLGDTALRVAVQRDLPLVVTHHTHAQLYLGQVPESMPWLATFLDNVSTGFCNLCDAVVAPSEGVRKELQEAGVERPIHVIPTGADEEQYAKGDREGFRAKHGIPQDAFVIGHVSRLSPEKNQKFLLEAMAKAANKIPGSHLLVIGTGPLEEELKAFAREAGLADRAHFPGTLQGQDLADAYHAMDLFGFASKSETQGMVISEALFAGRPVVALRARGVEDIMCDDNGLIVKEEDAAQFANALVRMYERRDEPWAQRCRDSVQRFGMKHTAKQMLALYESLLQPGAPRLTQREESGFAQLSPSLEAEYVIFSNFVRAAVDTLRDPAIE